MRVRLFVLPLLIVMTLATAGPARAGGGGDSFPIDWNSRFAWGQTIAAETDVYLGWGGGGPDDGPYYAYLVPSASFDGTEGLPDGAVLVDTVSVTRVSRNAV